MIKMSFFSRKKPVPNFIKKPIFDSRDTFMCDLYQLVYFPPFTLDEFTAKGITQYNGSAIYKTAVSVVKNIAYQLYQIPAVRNYYGSDFVHGFSAKYDTNTNSLLFENLDDTPETDQYTREITAAIEVIFQAFLDKYNVYIFYQGDSIQFINEYELKRLHKVKVQNRIVWVE